MEEIAAGFRPYDIADPFRFYARARAEAPVFYSDELGYWVVSRYEDAGAVFFGATAWQRHIHIFLVRRWLAIVMGQPVQRLLNK